MLAGCVIDRSAIGGGTGAEGGAPDAFVTPRLDAGGLDAPGLDAFESPIDAPGPGELDTNDPDPPDAWLAPPPDAWTSPDSPPACVMSPEVCNARDDDCNGMVDEVGCARMILPGVSGSCVGFTYGGHVYQMCKASVSLPWEAALMACPLFPPYALVRIDDNDENSAISSRVDEDAWIGLNDRVTEGALVWTDLSAVGYGSWAVGEPTSGRGASGGGEDCVSMRGLNWQDRYCGSFTLPTDVSVRAFVCEATIVR